MFCMCMYLYIVMSLVYVHVTEHSRYKYNSVHEQCMYIVLV